MLAACSPEAGDSPDGSAGTAGSDGSGSSGAGGDGSPDGGAAVGPARAVDLIFMVDNSYSMVDKQALLGSAVPDLVARLTNPVCIDAQGSYFPPPAQGEDCPAGQHREIDPVADVHVGVITSSLGDAGSNVACPAEGFPRYQPDRVDLAHLVGTLERGLDPERAPLGFLEWRPGVTGASDFTLAAQAMIAAAGGQGCGWESSLEAWYRFLVDPFPYAGLTRAQCANSTVQEENCVQPITDDEGRVVVDQLLLEQRAAFLRPESLVAVIMLTDENDCSTIIGDQNWVVLGIDDSRPMFRGSSACEQNPNDKCCFSCQLDPPSGCPADPVCQADPNTSMLENRLPAGQDGPSLRCFEQKRRFGSDFQYPTQRYINALTQRELCSTALDLSVEACGSQDIVDNPLFASGRPASRVFLAGILGVPWQLIASDVDAAGRPLAAGQLRYRDADELNATNTWDNILGTPGVRWRAPTAAYPEVVGTPPVPPLVPQMRESDLPRAGVEPGNAYNGREHDTHSLYGNLAPDDLQYSCIFRLPEPRDCALLDPSTDTCDCYSGDFDRPLCELTPGTSQPGTVQHWGKAYPPPRQLEVLKGIGDSGILTSICARNVSDATASDYGYRPAVAAILERMATALR